MSKNEERELFDKAVSKKVSNYKPSGFIIFILIITLLLSLFNFIYNIVIDNEVYYIVNSLLLLMFNIIFTMLVYKSLIRQKGLVILSYFLLIIIYTFNILLLFDVISFKTVDDSLYGKDLNTLIKYSKANNVKLEYDYEYSDMIKENHVISYKQDKDNMKVVISLGSNPKKNINLPNMVSWTDEDVLKYLEDNKLYNVEIKYVSSDKVENTLIRQNKKGVISRNDLLKLDFSYGNELSITDCKVRDLTGMSLPHVVMYLEKNHLNYEIIKEYSSKYKKDFVYKQSIEAGKRIKINDEKIKVYVSKGTKIEMIDLVDKDIYSVSDWFIKNNLIIKYEEKYDSKIEKDHIIKANKSKGDNVTSGEVITIYLSKGKLLMKNFKTFNDFKKWAIKNKIQYEDEYEFSTEYEAGEIISSSVKPGDTVESDDVITVVVSEGKKNTMINVVGMDKDKAIKELEDNNIKYNITYQEGDKNKVLRQSIRAGSEISKNTTVSLIIGK